MNNTNIKKAGATAAAALIAMAGIQAVAAAPAQAFSSSGVGTTVQNVAPYSVSTSASQAEAMVLNQINAYRAEHGLAAVRQDNGFTKGAREWAQHLADTNSPAGHPDGGNFFENVAYAASPERAVQLWKNSAGHNANMLDSRLTHGGVGVVERGNGSYAVVFRGLWSPSDAQNSKGHPAW